MAIGDLNAWILELRDSIADQHHKNGMSEVSRNGA